MRRDRVSFERVVVAAALSALAGGVAAASDDGLAARDAQVEAARESERTSERKRVLELAGGGFLRGMSRFVPALDGPEGGHWELREAGGWRALAPGEVTAARGERELLREAERLARSVGPREHERRVELADWMLRRGLEPEALAQLDRVLKAEPDQDAALGLVARGPFALPLADALVIGDFGGLVPGDPFAEPPPVALSQSSFRERLIALGADPSPARRELVIRRMRELHDQGALRSALLRELTAFRLRQRFFATHALRRLMPGEELRPLLSRAALDHSAEVRYGASLALRGSGEEAVILPLVRALESADGRVRINAAESLGNLGFPAAVPALVNHMARAAQSTSRLRPPGGHISVGSQVAYLQDFDIEIAQAASIADPRIGVVEDVVILEARASGFQQHSVVTEIATVRSALKQLTGHDAGRDPERWLRWYESRAE